MTRDHERAAASEVPRWAPGDTAVLRYLRRTDGRPATGWPFTVVEDRGERVALYLPTGAEFQVWHSSGWTPTGGQPQGRLVPDVARSDVLRLLFAGRQHSVWLFWQTAGGQRRFTGYYVNLEEPFRRTSIGFDSNDHALDIVVSPNLDWRLKDGAEFEEAVRRGVYREPFAASVRAEARAVAASIERREPPFDGSWLDWCPDPAWPRPQLPEGWADAPLERWERRDWAYGP